MTNPKQTTDDDASKKIDLKNIYPTAKTSEDRLKDDQDRERMLLSRQPRNLALFTATRLFIVVVLGMILFHFAPAIVMWNVISGAFNLVLGALLLFAIVKWQAGELSTAMDKKGVNDLSFFGVYLVVFVTPMVFACYYINHQDLLVMAMLYVCLFLLHLLFVYLLVRMLLKQQ